MYIEVDIRVKTDDHDPQRGTEEFNAMLEKIDDDLLDVFGTAYDKDRRSGVAGFPSGHGQVFYYGVHERR